MNHLFRIYYQHAWKMQHQGVLSKFNVFPIFPELRVLILGRSFRSKAHLRIYLQIHIPAQKNNLIGCETYANATSTTLDTN